MGKLALNIGEELWLGGRAGTGIGTRPGYSTLGGLISTIIFNVYTFAGVALLFLLIAGGFLVIKGAGEQDPERTAQGRKAATAAVIGFLVIFCSYWLIKIVDTLTGLNILGGGGL